MKSKKSLSTQDVWRLVRKQFSLSEAQVRMAKELGMNPKKLGKIANHKQEPWKMSLPDFIEHVYERRGKKVQT